MHFACIERPIGLDRLATSSEVRSAMSLSSLVDPEPDDYRDDVQEMDSEIRDPDSEISEDAMWLAIASEILDSTCN